MAGLEISTEIEGTARSLPGGVELAAFRIVQEALTNVARHARPATATVRVTYGEHDLIVEVSDDGRGEASGEAGGIGGEAGGTGGGEAGGETGERSPDGRPGGGNGIRDMRERAAAVGGRLEAGPRPGGGFRVRAQLPLDGPLWPGS